MKTKERKEKKIKMWAIIDNLGYEVPFPSVPTVGHKKDGPVLIYPTAIFATEQKAKTAFEVKGKAFYNAKIIPITIIYRV